MKNFELFEEVVVDLFKTLALVLRYALPGLPYLIIAYAWIQIIQATLAQPFTLTCKAVAEAKSARPAVHKKVVPAAQPIFGPEPVATPPAPILKMSPVEID